MLLLKMHIIFVILLKKEVGVKMAKKGYQGFWLGKKLSKEHRKKLSLAHKGKKLSEEHKRKLSLSNTGKIVSEDTRKKLSDAQYKYFSTHVSFNKGIKKSDEVKRNMGLAQKGHIVSDKTRMKISNTLKKRNAKMNKNKIIKKKRPHSGWHQSEETKLKISFANKGKPGFKKEKHPNWKNGITSLNKQIRNCDLYFQWRSDVFKRDEWICQTCHKKGCYLEAHHKKPLILIINENNIKTMKSALVCKELWDVNNGVTLCKDCHNLVKKRIDFYK